LTERYRTATDQATAWALVQEIEQVKRNGQVEVFRIQLECARRAGRLENAAKLEAAIEKLTSPPRPGAPQPRPLPLQPSR
jgi:hypothetical protein